MVNVQALVILQRESYACEKVQSQEVGIPLRSIEGKRWQVFGAIADWDMKHTKQSDLRAVVTIYNKLIPQNNLWYVLALS